MESKPDIAPSENAYERERNSLLTSFTTGSQDTESESLVAGADVPELTSEESEPNVRKCIEFIKKFSKDILTDEQKKNIIKDLDKEKVIRIMVCGSTGTGKSTILNGLVGTKVFTEGDTLNPETTKIETQKIKRPNCKAQVIVYDTPGFNDASGNDDEYIRRVGECGNIDVLIYCVSIRPTRAEMEHDTATLKQLRLALGPDIWKRSVVILTFANVRVRELKEKKESNVEEKFQEKIEQWKNEVHKSFKEAGIDFTDVPIVPAGCCSKPSLIEGSEEYWLSQVWYTIFDRASTDGKIVLLLINSHRFKSHKDIDSSAEIFDQPIVFEHDPNWLQKHFPKLIAGAGGAGSVTGASIGAAIGALAIGIPKFGVAAGVGLALGAAVGGGIGVGMGTATILLIAKFKAKRDKS